jgi:hypothetical protein
MRIVIMAGVAVLLAASHGEVAAQTRVNLTGTWGTAPAATTPRQELSTKEGTVGKGVAQLRIAQDGQQLRVFSGRMSATYALDGSETTNYVRVNGKLVPGRYRAEWIGSQLVVTGRVEVNGVTWVETQRMSLDESGSLTLDITNVGKGPPIRFRTTYVKRPDVTA